MSEWQPIETAPKDGTSVILYCKTWDSRRDKFRFRMFFNCWIYQSAMEWRAGSQNQKLPTKWFPTHWMPEPTPPEGL